jgi:hypothetical protein
MPHSHHGHHVSRSHSAGRNQTRMRELWDSFWNPPAAACPKCGSVATEYYDPFFFAPMRTLAGKRRIKCTSCRFIWRPSRRRKESAWERLLANK